MSTSEILDRHRDLPPLPPLGGDRYEASLMDSNLYHDVAASTFQQMPGAGGKSYILDGYRSRLGADIQAFMVRATGSVTSPWHMHHNETFGILTKGWGVWDFEGIGVVKVEAGTMFYQPPFNRHRELAMSDDCEQFIVISNSGDTRTTLFLLNEETGEYDEKVIETAEISQYLET
jgi:mannose-6-phosphate isomerase-like protein (cupin superfamily)